MARHIHTSFHTSGGAVRGCNGFSCSLVGRAIIANLISTERASSIGFQFNLPSSFVHLIFLQLEERRASGRSNHAALHRSSRLPHFCANICKPNSSETRRNSSKRGKNCCSQLLHFQTPLLPSSITVSPLLPPSASSLFSPKITPSPPTVFYSGLSLKADIIYRRSSCRLISQHKSLSPVHPSLTLHPFLPSPLPPTSFSATHPFFISCYSFPQIEKRPNGITVGLKCRGGHRELICAAVLEREQVH